MCFPHGSADKESTCSAGDTGDACSIHGLGRSPGEDVHPTAVFLPGKSHGQRSLVGCSLWAHKDSDMTWQLSIGHGDLDQILGS